jgi:hypothetical protein
MNCLQKKIVHSSKEITMAKKEEMSTAAKAKAARAKASGKVEIKPIKKEGLFSGKKPSEARYTRKANVLANAKKLTATKAEPLYMGGPNMVTKATAKKVDLDAYNLLAKKAKAAGLKGKDAEVAIQKALKAVSTRMTNDRQRTASRGEFIARRERKKRQNTDLS